MFGIDNFSMILKLIPERKLQDLYTKGISLFKDYQNSMQAKLMITVCLDKNNEHLVLSLYKLLEGGNLDPVTSYPVKDIKQILEFLKNLKNEPDNGQYSITGATGASPEADA